jgi:hypothetical protein
MATAVCGGEYGLSHGLAGNSPNRYNGEIGDWGWSSMRQTWIFQGNPKWFDIDGFLATSPARAFWTVSRYKDEIAVGDRVFLWRSVGKGDGVSGIVAEATVISPAVPRPDDEMSRPFWLTGDPKEIKDRADLRFVRVANKREILKRDWLQEDPVLRDLLILKSANSTNFKIDDHHAKRLDALWMKTGHDWNRSESVAGLWAYMKTHGSEVSKLPGSPVANVSLMIGRAVGGVYNKVMNFRALDPRDERAGMSGVGRVDQVVWDEFFDLATRTLNEKALEGEFDRLWGAVPPDASLVDEPEISSNNTIAESNKLVSMSLDQLMSRYAVGKVGKPSKPEVKSARTRLYERDPLVVAIGKKRAGFKCEVPNCQHPTFPDSQGNPYCEVHHLVMLADGGADTLENVVCLCPSHHREVHFGGGKAALTKALLEIRKADKKL